MRRDSDCYAPRIAGLAFAANVALLLAACAPKENPELQWARAALERNPQVKVMTVDTANNSITLRVVASGEIISVTPGELAAMPIADLVTLTQQARPAAPVAAEPLPSSAPERAVELPSASEPVPATPAPPSYTVEREEGHVRVSGPGISIETAAKREPTVEAIPVRGDDPVICDGKMLLHLDGRTLNVGGDAVIARGGCELHITNSRITAAGTALTVLDATVHIANSELQGDDGSLTASSAARIYVRNSKFTGLSRRDPKSAIQDQGGNTWR